MLFKIIVCGLLALIAFILFFGFSVVENLLKEIKEEKANLGKDSTKE